MGLTFRCDGEAMETMKGKIKDIQEILEKTKTKGEEIEGEISSKTYWESKSQETMAAYMDLLIQYHTDLASGREPLKKAEEALDALEKNLESFYKNWAEWEGLNSIV